MPAIFMVKSRIVGTWCCSLPSSLFASRYPNMKKGEEKRNKEFELNHHPTKKKVKEKREKSNNETYLDFLIPT